MPYSNSNLLVNWDWHAILSYCLLYVRFQLITQHTKRSFTDSKVFMPPFIPKYTCFGCFPIPLCSRLAPYTATHGRRIQQCKCILPVRITLTDHITYRRLAYRRSFCLRSRKRCLSILLLCATIVLLR